MSGPQVERYVFETLMDTAKSSVKEVRKKLTQDDTRRDSGVSTEHASTGCAEERLFAKRLLSCECCHCALYTPVVMGDGMALCKDCAASMKTKAGSEVFGQGTCTVLNELVQLCYPTAYEASKAKHACNSLYAKGSYTEALDAYTTALDKTPDSPALWLNRATVQLELNNAHKALDDANTALSLSYAGVHYPSSVLYVKAMYRQAAAYLALGQYADAVTAFSILLAWQADGGAEAMLRRSIHLLINKSAAKDTEDVRSSVASQVGGVNDGSTSGDSSSSKVNENTSEKIDISDRLDDIDMIHDDSTRDKADNDEPITCETDLYEHSLLVPVFKDLADTDGMLKGMFQGYTQKDIIHVNNASLPQIREKLDCPVCYQLLYQPTTLPCGHMLCRPCVGRTLDQAYPRSPSCPMCRSDLREYLQYLNFQAMARSAVGDRSDYVHYLSSINTTQVVQTLIETYFESEYLEREEQSKTDENATAQTDSSDLPIFCCSLMLPGTSTTLQIFEPRYRLMIRRCIDNGSRAFGTVNSLHDKYGGLVQMTSYKQRPDGTSIIEVTGTKVFKIESFGSRDGYSTAKAVWQAEDGSWPQAPDTEDDADADAPAAPTSADSGSDVGSDEDELLDMRSIPALRDLASRTEAGSGANADQSAAQTQHTLEAATSRILADMRSDVQSLVAHPLLRALVAGSNSLPPPTDDEHFLNWCMALTLRSRMQYELAFGEAYRDNYHLRVGVVHLLWQKAVVHILSTFGPPRTGTHLS